MGREQATLTRITRRSSNRFLRSFLLLALLLLMAATTTKIATVQAVGVATAGGGGGAAASEGQQQEPNSDASSKSDEGDLEIGEEEPAPLKDGESASSKHHRPATSSSSSATTTANTESSTTTTNTGSSTAATTGDSDQQQQGGEQEAGKAATGAETSTPTPPEQATSAAGPAGTAGSEASAGAAETEATDAGSGSTDAGSGAEAAASRQSGPFVDLFGPHLLSLEMVDATHAQLASHLTNDALRNKKVVGVYFSADWCGPCRKFTPELVSFYKKMNERRGKKGDFEIVWVSRCRDVNSFGQYFTHMGGWYALPPEAAMGAVGQKLSDMYKVKSIPTLVLLDEIGNVITRDGRNKIPKDKAGIGFPWRNPISNIYVTLVPRSLRFLIKSQIEDATGKAVNRAKRILGLQRRTAPAAAGGGATR